MKYLLLIYSNPASWVHPMFLQQPAEVLSEDERASLMAEFTDLLQEITDTGELVGSGALSEPSAARTVQVRAGVTTVTDGPFAETKEHLAGYFLLDCDRPERATELAARFPDARFAAVELRPIMALGDPES